MERQTRNIRFRSNKRQNLIITSFSSWLGRWIIQQIPYKRQRRANPSVHIAFQRKLEKELTIAKNKRLHNNNASPSIDPQCISRPKK
jgi:hypothetical protein